MPLTPSPSTSPKASPLQLQRAAFGYGERAVVADVDLTVARGEVVALLGPNGSGKTTLVKGVLGLADHLGGSVTIFGSPRAELTDRTRIGYVPQRHSLSASVTATVEEVVAVGRVPHHPWWAPWRSLSRSDRAIVADAIETVGLADYARHDVATLSGGQQRRVLIARALAAQPELFFLDEPTAGVDVGNQRVLTQVLGRLVERGATLVIVTHELAALRGLFTRAVVIQSGRVTYDGSPGGLAPGAAHVDHHPPFGDGHELDGSLGLHPLGSAGEPRG